MAELAFNRTVVHELLLLGTLTMLLAEPNGNRSMENVVDSILSATPLNRTFLDIIQTRVKEFGHGDIDPLGPLTFLQLFIKAHKNDPRLIAWPNAIITVGVTGVFVALRLVVKKYALRRVKVDDWFILVAWITAFIFTLHAYFGNYPIVAAVSIFGLWLISLSIFFKLEEEYLFGCRHVWQYSPSQFKTSLRIMFTMEIAYVVCAWIIKACIMVFYWNLVPSGERKFRFFKRSIIFVCVGLTGFAIAALMTVIFQCEPVDFWNHPLDKKCLPLGNIWTVVGFIIAISDVLMLLLPIRVVWMLKLERREKIVVSLLFCLGGLSCIVDIPRIYKTLGYINDPDITFKRCTTNIWIELEFCLAIIAVCIPALKYLLTRYIPSKFPCPCPPKDTGSRSSELEIMSAFATPDSGARSPRLTVIAEEEEPYTGQRGRSDSLAKSEFSEKVKPTGKRKVNRAASHGIPDGTGRMGPIPPWSDAQRP